jgi:hypothetical protein
MCGIIRAWSNSKRPVNKFIEEAYHLQKARGSEGFGYVAIRDGIAYVERAEQEGEILKKLKAERASEILFHHRKPTSTENLVIATHPIFVSNDLLEFDYLVVHNGVITNDDLLKEKHNAMGFEYSTEHEKTVTINWKGGSKIRESVIKFNDSESLAIEVALFAEGKKKDMDFMGSAAIIAYQLEKVTGRVLACYWGHNTGNPLYQETIKRKGGVIYTMRSHVGGGSAVPTGTLYRWDYVAGVGGETVADIGQSYKNSLYTKTGEWINGKWVKKQEEPDKGYYETNEEYYERVYGEKYDPGKIGFRDRGISVSVPLLDKPRHKPDPKDFDTTMMNIEEKAKRRDEIDGKLGAAEDELAFWQSEHMSSVDGATRVAIKAEIERTKKLIAELEDEYDDLINEAVESGYFINDEG